MSLIDGGQALVATLKRFDVDTIFTLHGGHLDCVYQAAATEGMRIIDHRHEQAAGIAATGYARTTGKVGVAMVTAGGAVTNVVTAITNAYADCVASVFFGGAPPLRDYDALPVNSGYDQLSVMGGITKWAHRVTHVERLPYLVGRAFQIAKEGRPGPVYLDLPSDVLFALLDSELVDFLPSGWSLRRRHHRLRPWSRRYPCCVTPGGRSFSPVEGSRIRGGSAIDPLRRIVRDSGPDQQQVTRHARDRSPVVGAGFRHTRGRCRAGSRFT